MVPRECLWLQAVFFSYPFVSQSTGDQNTYGQSMFQGFSCRVLDDATPVPRPGTVYGGEHIPERYMYLDVDYQISCEDSGYLGFIVFGTAGVMAYPLGTCIPSLTLLLLFKNGK